MNLYRPAILVIVLAVLPSLMCRGQVLNPSHSNSSQNEAAGGIAGLHAQEIKIFRERALSLGKVMQQNGVKEVLWSAVMTAQSGATPVAIAPVRLQQKQTVDMLLNSPTPYAVLYVSAPLSLLQTRKPLPEGAYLLVFARHGAEWRTSILDAQGEKAADLSTREVAFQTVNFTKEDPVQKAKRLLKQRGIDIKIVDIEVEFNGSTEVFVSFLIWRWSLFEDPPLPY